MTCDEWKLFLQDYLDGALSEPAKRAIDAHLSECASCFDDARAHRQVLGWLEGAPVEPPAGLADRVMAGLAPASSWKREFARLAAAALIVVGVGAGAAALIPADRLKPSADLPRPDVTPILRYAGFER